MASRRGSLLERNVEQLLKLSGLNPQINRFFNGYEIDVFLRYKNKLVAFECKQYERSTLAIRNLIHQWDSKNKELKLDKVVLVIIGCDISQTDYDLAEKYSITIWNENKLTYLLDNAIEKKEDNLNTVLRAIGLTFSDAPVIEPTIEKSKQYYIFKNAFDKILKDGVRGTAFIIFENEPTQKFVQFALEDNGFFLDIPKLDDMQYEKAIDILEYFNYDVYFDEKADYNDNLNILNSECGENTDILAYLCDKFFKELYQITDYDYNIKATICLDGYDTLEYSQ